MIAQTTGGRREPRATPASVDPEWGRPAGDVVARLATDPGGGLSEAEATARLRRHGANVLPAERGRSLAGLVLEQLTDTMIVVLLAAAVLTTVVGDGKDTVVILAVVALNTSLGVYQERKAARAVAELAQLQAPTARVVRGGTSRQIAAEALVPGDLVELEAGDAVPADLRLLLAAGLQVDEALLTGESVPVLKDADALAPDAAPVAERLAMVHAGTTVTSGRARGVVVRTASDTELGRMAGLLLRTEAPVTQLQRRLGELGRILAVGCVALCLLVLVVGLLRGQPAERMVVTAISLAVAAIPESLPAVVALSLALGAQRMAKRHALVRRLPAVESLGSVTVIASDKTGTLTEGRMRARTVWLPTRGRVDVGDPGDPSHPGDDGGARQPTADLRRLLESVVLCNDATFRVGSEDDPDASEGDPTERALLELARRFGCDVEGLRRDRPRVGELPFDVGRRRMTTRHRDGDRLLTACKGAPEALLSEPAVLRTSPADIEAAHAAASALAADGLRVLAVAARTDPAGGAADGGSVPVPEVGLELLGLVGLEDPVRPAAPSAVAAAQTAGIVPLLITGDHPATALAVARQVGIAESAERVLTGAQLAADGAEQDLTRIRVFARIAPEQKLDIVQAWRAKGHVVAMTGDGVNDAPALRQADVGVAMGLGGTDVAREAADVVLADDDFATIVAAVSEGRRVYGNIRQFLHYALAGGVAEILVMLFGPAVGLVVPLLPAQILWINLLTHGLPGVGFGAEPAEPDVLRRPPRDPQQSVVSGGLWQGLGRLGLVLALGSLALGAVADATDRPAQTFVFLGLGWAVLLTALPLRSESRAVWRISLRSNLLLVGAVVAGLVLQLLAIEWGPLRDFLDLEHLSLPDLALIGVVSLLGAVVVEIEKALSRRR